MTGKGFGPWGRGRDVTVCRCAGCVSKGKAHCAPDAAFWASLCRGGGQAFGLRRPHTVRGKPQKQPLDTPFETWHSVTRLHRLHGYTGCTVTPVTPPHPSLPRCGKPQKQPLDTPGDTVTPVTRLHRLHGYTGYTVTSVTPVTPVTPVPPQPAHRGKPQKQPPEEITPF